MSTYEISKSSLLSLKAEILRKQQELVKAKAENVVKIKSIKQNTPLELKNKGVQERHRSDLLNEEDEDLLKKSRSALEAKSKLYDKLSAGTDKLSDEQLEFNKRYLVRFDKKRAQSNVYDLPPDDSDEGPDVDKYPESDDGGHISDEYEPAKNPDDEWVEYVDCLGRTRKCLRKDLEYLKSKDQELKDTVDARRREDCLPLRENNLDAAPDNDGKGGMETSEQAELLSHDMRREFLRRQWEKEEEELKEKSNIHYQDILFSEARTHGVGYYGFSKDEDERLKQQEALKKLREETEHQQKKSQELKALREKQLAARLKAAKNRKRARMGLPPEEEEQGGKEPTKVSEPEKTEEDRKLEEEKSKNDEKEKILEAARRKHVRPWDVGKEGVKEHYEYTQEEWVEKQRNERIPDFAPPTSYRKNFRSNINNSELAEKDTSLKFSTKRRRIYNDKQLLSSGINPYKSNENTTTALGSEVLQKYEDIKQNPHIEPTAIIDECDGGHFDDPLLGDFYDSMVKPQSDRRISSESDGDSADDIRGKGREVPPPPTFEYYGPSSTKKSRVNSRSANIQDSIEAGLKYLRKQVEKKESSTMHPTEMFLS